MSFKFNNHIMSKTHLSQSIDLRASYSHYQDKRNYFTQSSHSLEGRDIKPKHVRQRSSNEYNMWHDLLARTSSNGFVAKIGKRCSAPTKGPPPCKSPLKPRSINKRNDSSLTFDSYVQPRIENRITVAAPCQLRTQFSSKITKQYLDNQQTYTSLIAKNKATDISTYCKLDGSKDFETVYKKEILDWQQPEWKKTPIRKALPQSIVYKQLLKFKQQKDPAFPNSKYY